MTGTDNQLGETPAREGGYVTLIDLINVVLRNRRRVLLCAVVLALGSITWSLASDRSYVASASFMPRSGESSLGGANVIARQLGIIGTGAEAGRFSPQFYAALIHSRRIMESVLMSSYTTQVDTRRRTLVDIWDVNGSSPGIIKTNAVDRLRQSTSVSVHAETGVIQLSVATADPLLSELIAARILEHVSAFNLETRQTQALDETRFVSERLDQVMDSLRSVEDVLLAFLEGNRVIENSPSLVFERDRLQRQVIHQQALYSSLAESLEGARLEVEKDLPVLTIINRPDGSAVPLGKRAVTKAVVASMVGIILGILAAFLYEHFRREAEYNRRASSEFRSLIRAVFDDIRHPMRLFGTERRQDRNT